MIKRIIRAEDILKEKNFSFPPFNTTAFTDAVVSFFQEHDVSASLMLVPLRFVAIDDTPSDGFGVSVRVYNELRERYVYRTPSFVPCLGWRSPADTYDWDDEFAIFINEVYMNNAVALLKMLGFIVGRPRKCFRNKVRHVTLV